MREAAERLGYIDVGGRGGLKAEIAPFLDRLIPVLCEPEPEEFARLVAASEGGRRYRTLAAALAHVDGPLPFYETENPHCSSILPVNRAVIDRYPISVHFRFKRQSEILCARYDTLYRQQDLPKPHIVKIDVQGFESRVLQGFGALLHDCLAVELESHFYPIYEDQRLLHDIVAYLADYDLVLRRLSNPRAPDLNGDRHFEMDLIEVDAVFTKSHAWARKADAEARARLNFACQVLGAPANR